MAFNSTSGKAEYIASSGQTVFTFLFKIYEETDLKVYQTPSGSTPDDTADLLALTTDYTVTINGDSGGDITLVSGATSGDTLVLKRSLPIDRDVEYQTSGDLLAVTLNGDQDYQTYLILDSDTESDRLLKLPDTDVNMSSSLPTSIANYGLFVNDAGTAFEYRVADATGGALKAWESEANSLTSASYATQVEDTFVDEYSSDGDGTFTATPTTDYSALHWAAKAATFNPALYATLTGATFTGDITATNLLSGTSSPSTVIVSNITSPVNRGERYTRVGDIVHVSGSQTITITSSANMAEMKLTLPIASNLSDEYSLSGTITATTFSTSIRAFGDIEGSASDNKALFEIYSV